MLEVLQWLEKPLCRAFIEILDEVFHLIATGGGASHLSHEIAVRPSQNVHRGGAGIWVKQNLDGIGHLRLDAQIDLNQQKFNQGLGQGLGLLVDGLEDVCSHHDRIVVNEGDQDVASRDSDSGIRVTQGESQDVQQTSLDEVVIELSARLCLYVFRDGGAVGDEEHSILLALLVGIRRTEDGEEFGEECDIGLYVVDNVDLVEENQRVEDGEGGVVQDAGQDDVFEVLQAVYVVDLPLDLGILDFDDFSEL